MTHAGHEIVKCSQCREVIRQCRCASNDKPVRWDNCGCKNKPVSERIRGIRFAFDVGDSRREKITELADIVAEMEQQLGNSE